MPIMSLRWAGLSSIEAEYVIPPRLTEISETFSPLGNCSYVGDKNAQRPLVRRNTPSLATATAAEQNNKVGKTYMSTFNKVAAVLNIGVLLSGCASVIKGSTQSINISTPPTTGAICNLSSAQGNWQVMSPGAVSVDKSKEDIQIRCAKPGWQEAALTIPSNFEGWTVGNILLGGVVGIGVDAATGAINEYPHTFQVPMMQATGMPAIGTPMALTAPQPIPAPLPSHPPSPPVYAPPPPAGAADTGSQTVLFPVTINNPYHPSWTVGAH